MGLQELSCLLESRKPVFGNWRNLGMRNYSYTSNTYFIWFIMVLLTLKKSVYPTPWGGLGWFCIFVLSVSVRPTQKHPGMFWSRIFFNVAAKTRDVLGWFKAPWTTQKSYIEFYVGWFGVGLWVVWSILRIGADFFGT